MEELRQLHIQYQQGQLSTTSLPTPPKSTTPPYEATAVLVATPVTPVAQEQPVSRSNRIEQAKTNVEGKTCTECAIKGDRLCLGVSDDIYTVKLTSSCYVNHVIRSDEGKSIFHAH
jgi:hypothetical protein